MNKLSDFRIGDKVMHPDDPHFGIVENIDHEEGMVIVDFPIHGAYGHPNGIVDVDPSELTKVEEG